MFDLMNKKGKHLHSIKYESDETVRRALLEFVVYIVFLIMATIVASSVQHIYMFYFNETMLKLFLNREIETAYGKEIAFENIVTTSDWWSYMEGNFLDGLHGENSTETRKLLRDNILLGPPRLRQMRVKENSCQINDAFKRYFNSCYTSYSYWNEDTTESFKGTHYSSKSQLSSVGVHGEITYYYGGGYVKSLSYDRETNEETIKDLKQSYWIDRGTRIILLEFVLYNSNANMFENVKIIAELPPVGGMVTSHKLQALKFSIWMEDSILLYIAAAIFYLMAVLYTIVEVIEVKANGWRSYFASLWNLLDISVLMLIYISFIYNIVNPVMLTRLLEKINRDPNQFLSIDGLCYWNDLYTNMTAVYVFLVWLKIFKFISVNKTMLHISTTLSRCAADLFGFLIMFFIIFVAYALLGLLMFGSTHPDFRTFGNALVTLMRMVLGDFEYKLLEEANYILGPIYFISYVLLVFFILLNMFLAVVNDTYVEVKSEITQGENHLGKYLKKLWRSMGRILTKCCPGLKFDDDTDADKTAKTGTKRPESDTRGRSRQQESQEPTRSRSRTPLNLDGILKEYYEEISSETEEPNAGEENDRKSAEYSDALKRLEERVEFLEDLLEKLIDQMDVILNKMEGVKKLNKKDA